MSKSKKNPSMPHSLIISEIAKDTHIHKDVVKLVVNRYIDIAIEQIVNERGFTMPNVFTVVYHDTPVRPSPNGKEIIPSRRYSKLKLSRRVRDLFTMRQVFYPDHLYVINRDTWVGAVKWMWTPEHQKKLKEAKLQKRQNDLAKMEEKEIEEHSLNVPTQADLSNEGVLYNPLLDDDDE